MSLLENASYFALRGLNTEALKASGVFCRLCGKPITKPSRTRTRKFCSDACKSVWWNRHRFDHAGSSAITQFSCRACGKQLRDYGSADRKYCSQDCYRKRGAQMNKSFYKTVIDYKSALAQARQLMLAGLISLDEYFRN